MKIRDSVSKETLKQFKSIAPGSNRKKSDADDPRNVPTTRRPYPEETRNSRLLGVWLQVLW
ncbi:hypothetical protein ACFCVS_08615 [Bacillus altitudinis]|uniref:hypothetical protein n=1 Tax=Bacillus altitudinis TaxID=293387 RepID=UPI0035D9FB9B